jgi:WD40 repeat protein
MADLYDPDDPLRPRRTTQVQRTYTHDAPVNDVVIHPNQGELVSCDQSGSVKIWDLGENTCTHELVSAWYCPSNVKSADRANRCRTRT